MYLFGIFGSLDMLLIQYYCEYSGDSTKETCSGTFFLFERIMLATPVLNLVNSDKNSFCQHNNYKCLIALPFTYY